MGSTAQTNEKVMRQIETHVAHGNYVQAEKLANAGLANLSDDPSMLYAALAEIRNLQQDFDAAQTFAEKSINENPANINGQFQLGNAYLGMHETDKAEAIFNQLEPSLKNDAAYIAQLSRLGLKKHDLNKAFEHAVRASNLKPKKPEFHILKAEVLLAQKRAKEAVAVAKKAVKIEKKSAHAWVTYIRATLATGRQAEFSKVMQEARKALPGSPVIDTEVNEYLIAQGKCMEAEAALKKILRSYQDCAPAYQALAGLYLKTNQWEKAIETGYKALGFSPYSLKVWKLIGTALAENDEHFLAVGWLHKALLADPEDVLIATEYAHSLHNLREFEAAHDLYLQILAEQPENPSILHLYAVLLMDMERNKEAIEVVRKAHALAQGEANIRMNLGTALTNAGELKEARNIYRQIMQERPDMTESFLYYTQITPMEDDTEVEAMIGRQMDRSKELKQKEELNFALAKIHEDKHDYDSSFTFLERACSLHKERCGYDERGNIEGLRLIASIFSREFMDRLKGCGNDSRRPIFVLGMPRSGTTLVEQILSSHPQVVGGGELTFVDAVLRNHAVMTDKPFLWSLSDLTCDQLPALASDYLTLIDSVGPADKYVVNKLPHNFMHIGLISLMFPNASIIHLKRNPMATCFSCYKKRFTKGHDYSFNLEDLGHYYLAYLDLMRHWNELLPGRIYNVEYEALTSNFEEEARKLIDYCGIEWDDACLAFHKNKRAVRTASQTQIRKPIYTNAVAFWKNFETQLKPLSDIVQAADGDEIRT